MESAHLGMLGQASPDPAEHDALRSWFENLFAANHDDLLRHVLRRVDADAAADIVSEVFLTAWRRRAEFDRTDARLWLFGVARNVIANERRAQARRVRLTARVTEQLTVEDSSPPTVSARVLTALSSLPATEQEALRLVEWDELSIAEAAEVTGCSRATFRVRLHRARRRLAVRLSEELPTRSEPS